MSSPKLYPAPLKLLAQPVYSKGSDHSKSHIGPSIGTSYNQFKFLIWSSLSIEGDKPPCNANILSSIKAVSGKQSKASVKNHQTFGLPYFHKHSS